MAPVTLNDFTLNIDVDGFYEMFWGNAQWFEEFLINKLKDLSVSVGDWAPSPEQPNAHTRTVKSYHPAKISFPGLPSHAESWKVQTIEVTKDVNGVGFKLVMKEVNNLRGIPYSDYFSVLTEWVVVALPAATGASASCKVSIFLDFEFHKYTWLQGTIESNTKAELIEMYELWLQSAQESLRRALDRKMSTLSTLHALRENLKADNLDDDMELTPLALDLETGPGNNNNNENINTNNNILSLDTITEEEGGAMDKTNSKRGSTANSSNNVSRSPSTGEMSPGRRSRSHGNSFGSGSGYPSDGDEDLQFFDCEEVGDNNSGGSGNSSLQGRASNRRNSLSASTKNANVLSPELLRFYQQDERGYGMGYKHSHPQLHGDFIEDNLELGQSGNLASPVASRLKNMPPLGAYPPQFGLGNGLEDPAAAASAKDIAVALVEGMFVLAEFSYWQVHQKYAYELKEVFDIEPGKVVSRVFNSFLPGWHSPLLLQPDLYGPVLAVIGLPQSLLLSMEISRHGCNPTSQLGNALVVSLFIWFGLSALYRLLALLVAPSIEFKHCLCVTGYGFFAWNAALLCSYPIENYKEYVEVPLMLPLVLFGLPAALAQGVMFWEHTPASSLTLQPSSLSALPPALQQCAAHSRCLQKVVWMLPKIVAFVLVAGTHYQFLWYMARVFLPGRRQLCRLSALVQPSMYADILTQKELRDFAISLFGNLRN
eukprot:gene11246-13086_t